MPRGGRFGKYGDSKRRAKLRLRRIPQRGRINSDLEPKRSTDRRPGPKIPQSEPSGPGSVNASEVFMEAPESPDQKKKRLHIVVRPMEIDDLSPVFHLGERLFTAQDVPNLYRTWDEYEVIELFQTDTEFCLVAEIDDKIVGFALGTTITKSRSAWKYGHLVWLGIDPDHQAQGIASKLFFRFRDLMLENGVRMLLVDSEADNLPALHFFRKMGFGSPQEHIYLSLNLDPHLKQLREKKANGRALSRYKVPEDE